MKIKTLMVSIFFFAVPCSHASETVEYTGYQYQDPFYKTTLEKSGPVSARPAAQTPTTERASSYLLGGTLWNSANPMAIINGQIVKAGDKIGNAEVLEIGKEGVLLKELNKEWLLGKDTRKPK